MLRSLLSLRIKEVEMKKDIQSTAPKKKFMDYKEKKKNLSRMQRKVWSSFVFDVFVVMFFLLLLLLL